MCLYPNDPTPNIHSLGRHSSKPSSTCLQCGICGMCEHKPRKTGIPKRLYRFKSDLTFPTDTAVSLSETLPCTIEDIEAVLSPKVSNLSVFPFFNLFQPWKFQLLANRSSQHFVAAPGMLSFKGSITEDPMTSNESTREMQRSAPSLLGTRLTSHASFQAFQYSAATQHTPQVDPSGSKWIQVVPGLTMSICQMISEKVHIRFCSQRLF